MLSGSIEDTNYNSDYPHGGFFIMDMAAMPAVLTSSVRFHVYIEYWATWIDNFFPYDFDIDQDNDFILSITSSAARSTNPSTVRYTNPKWGRSGDAHDIRVEKYTLNPTTGAISFGSNFGMDVSQIDSCEVISVYGTNFYIICGFLGDK